MKKLLTSLAVFGFALFAFAPKTFAAIDHSFTGPNSFEGSWLDGDLEDNFYGNSGPVSGLPNYITVIASCSQTESTFQNYGDYGDFLPDQGWLPNSTHSSTFTYNGINELRGNEDLPLIACQLIFGGCDDDTCDTVNAYRGPDIISNGPTPNGNDALFPFDGFCDYGGTFAQDGACIVRRGLGSVQDTAVGFLPIVLPASILIGGLGVALKFFL